jgi:hypothetical protein
MSTEGSACSSQPVPPSSAPASNLFIWKNILLLLLIALEKKDFVVSDHWEMCARATVTQLLDKKHDGIRVEHAGCNAAQLVTTANKTAG